MNLVSASTLYGCSSAQPIPATKATAFTQIAAVADPLANMTPKSESDVIASRIVNRAKDEARRAVTYDASYCKMEYPGGDVPKDRGACTDVVIRSLRSAGFDLQELIHTDMLRNPKRYGRKMQGGGPDANIDHRRVPNQKAYMRFHATSLPVETIGNERQTWHPGDIVYWKLDNGLDHCGIISNTIGRSGLPTVIHNLAVAAQEDVLTSWKIVAHYRFQVRQMKR